MTFEHRIECRHLDRLSGLVACGQRGVPLDLRIAGECGGGCGSRGRKGCIDYLARCPPLPALGGAIGEGLDKHAVPAGTLEQIADAEGVTVVGPCLDEEPALTLAEQIPEERIFAVLRTRLGSMAVAVLPAGGAPALEGLCLAGTQAPAREELVRPEAVRPQEAGELPAGSSGQRADGHPRQSRLAPCSWL